jgi:hypothetical protein
MAGCWWRTPVILAIEEAEIGQIVRETQSQKNPSQKRAGGVVQGKGPEFKLQYNNKKKKEEEEEEGKKERIK